MAFQISAFSLTGSEKKKQGRPCRVYKTDLANSQLQSTGGLNIDMRPCRKIIRSPPLSMQITCLLQDAFSLLAYQDPWNSPVGYQLDPVQREPICAALNSAILGMFSKFLGRWGRSWQVCRVQRMLWFLSERDHSDSMRRFDADRCAAEPTVFVSFRSFQIQTFLKV